MKIPNMFLSVSSSAISLARIVSEDSQPVQAATHETAKSSKDS